MSEQQANTEFDLAGSPSHLLHRAQQAAVNLCAGTLAEQGLTLRQFAVLAALANADGQSQSSLVDKTGIDRSTLADMVGRMEKAGYIKRVESTEDRRAKAVSLLAKGRKSFESAAPAVEAADQEVLSLIRANRRVGFLASLAAIGGPEEEAEVLDEAAEEAGTKSKAKKAKGKKADKKKKKKKKKK